jgi:hypothetical protein
VEVAHGGGDVLVAELVLHGGEVGGVRFQRVRGEGVAEVLGEKPRTVMSRIMRVRSSLMKDLRRKNWDGGDSRRGIVTTESTNLLRTEVLRRSMYRASGLVQPLGSARSLNDLVCS